MEYIRLSMIAKQIDHDVCKDTPQRRFEIRQPDQGVQRSVRLLVLCISSLRALYYSIGRYN